MRMCWENKNTYIYGYEKWKKYENFHLLREITWVQKVINENEDKL